MDGPLSRVAQSDLPGSSAGLLVSGGHAWRRRRCLWLESASFMHARRFTGGLGAVLPPGSKVFSASELGGEAPHVPDGASVRLRVHCDRIMNRMTRNLCSAFSSGAPLHDSDAFLTVKSLPHPVGGTPKFRRPFHSNLPP